MLTNPDFVQWCVIGFCFSGWACKSFLFAIARSEPCFAFRWMTLCCRCSPSVMAWWCDVESREHARFAFSHSSIWARFRSERLHNWTIESLLHRVATHEPPFHALIDMGT